MAQDWNKSILKCSEALDNVVGRLMPQFKAQRGGNYTIVKSGSTESEVTDELIYRHEKGDDTVQSFKRLFGARSIIVMVLVIVLGLQVLALLLLPRTKTVIASSGDSDESSSQQFAGPATGAHPIIQGNRGCGDSYESALSANCKFNRLTISWEQPTCSEPYVDLIHDFVRQSNFNITTDTEGLEVVHWPEVSHGLRRYHIPWEYHVSHCVFIWKMMQRAVTQQLPLPDNLLLPKHTRHCVNVLLDQRWDQGDTHTLIHIKWPKCYGPREWEDAHYSDKYD